MRRMDCIDDLAALFDSRGGGGEGYFGEPVTITEHMLQAGALAAAAGAAPALVVAALLHDVGHLTQPAAAQDDWHREHDRVGAEWLGLHFPPEVSEPVRLHVVAKRYLCAVEPDYVGRLSSASIRTLELQGVALSTTEAAAFAGHPHCDEAVRLRGWDEAVKVPGRAVATFAHYVPLVDSLLVS